LKNDTSGSGLESGIQDQDQDQVAEKLLEMREEGRSCGLCGDDYSILNPKRKVKVKVERRLR
jgi:hypothetical protein